MQCPHCPEEGFVSLGSGVTGDWELPDVVLATEYGTSEGTVHAQIVKPQTFFLESAFYSLLGRLKQKNHISSSLMANNTLLLWQNTEQQQFQEKNFVWAHSLRVQSVMAREGLITGR